MIVGQLESGCCSSYILESCLQRNEIRWRKKLITCQVTEEKITQHRAATNESDEWFLSFLSLNSEIIELYLFSGARSLLLAKLTEDQMIRKSSRLWNFVESFFKLRLDILYYSNFFQSVFIRNFLLLFTFVFLHNYSTLIYLSTLANFPFRQCRVRQR